MTRVYKNTCISDVAQEQRVTNKLCMFVATRQPGVEKALRFVVGGRQRFTQHLAFLMSDQDNEGREGKEHVGKFGAIEPLSSGLENTMVR